MRRELAVLCLTIDDGKVLMVKRLKEPCLGCLVPPGGHVEDGELPHEACVRETLEEASWLVEVLETVHPNRVLIYRIVLICVGHGWAHHGLLGAAYGRVFPSPRELRGHQ